MCKVPVFLFLLYTVEVCFQDVCAFQPMCREVTLRSPYTYQVTVLNRNFLLFDPTMYDDYYEMKLFFCTKVAKENMLYC